MIAFIDDHRKAHGVEPICKVLLIAPSTYHDHVAKRRDPARLSVGAKRDEALKVEVRRVFAENFRVYGVRKVWRHPAIGLRQIRSHKNVPIGSVTCSYASVLAFAKTLRE
jgi:hypothetical protein